MERVRVIHPLIGGSFGRKEDIGLQILAALGSFQTRRPLMLVNSREESIQYHTKRHAITLRYRTGVNSEGKVLVQEITIWETLEHTHAWVRQRSVIVRSLP